MNHARALNEEPQIEFYRIALLAWAVLCWKWAWRLWDGGDLALSNVGFWVGIMGPMLGFALMWRALGPLTSKHATYASLISALYASFAFVLIDDRTRTESGIFFTTDGHIYLDYAARLLRRGVNPYAFDMFDSFRVFRSPLIFNTPLIDGDMTGRVAYPSLSFLVLVPFQWLHVNTRFVYPLFLFACFVLLLVRVKPHLRPLVLLPFFLDDSFVGYAFGGVTDSVWALLLMLVIATWQRSLVWAGVFLGLACSYKHQPWLVAPFLAIRAALEAEGPVTHKLRRAALLTGAAAVPFILLNLPFALWDFPAWVTGSIEPIRAQMVAYGQGLSALTMTGRVPIDKSVYGLMFASAFALLLWLYHRHFLAIRELAWIAPSIALWFSNRGLSSYWYLNALPFALALTDRNTVFTFRSFDARRARTSALVVSGFAAAVAVTIGVFAARAPAFGIWVDGPITVYWENVLRMTVHVENKRDVPIRPQFFVETHFHQPVLWKIASGPKELAPLGMAEFDIEAPWPLAEPNTVRGAIVTVAEHGTYANRASARVNAAVDSRYPDVIPNGDFTYWTSNGSPQFWKIVRTHALHASAQYVRDVASATWSEVELTLPTAAVGKPRSVELDTLLLLPEHPIEVTVRVPHSANRVDDPSLLYGMRVEVKGENHLILFGDHEGVGRLSDGTPFFGVKTPRGQWVRRVVHLREILTALGADLRAERLRLPRFELLDFPMVQVHVRLSLITSRPNAVRARFGRIRSLTRSPDVEHLLDLGLSRPEDIALWHSLYKVERGLGQEAADEALALAFAEPTGANLFVAGEVAFQQKRYDAAAEVYKAAADAGYEPVLSHLGAGRSLLESGALGAALVQFEAVIRLAKADAHRSHRAHIADAYEGIAAVKAEGGDCERAHESLKERERWTDKSAQPRRMGMLSVCLSRMRSASDAASDANTSVAGPTTEAQAVAP